MPTECVGPGGRLAKSSRNPMGVPLGACKQTLFRALNQLDSQSSQSPMCSMSNTKSGVGVYKAKRGSSLPRRKSGRWDRFHLQHLQQLGGAGGSR